MWIGFYEIDDTEYGFDDAIRGHDDINIYIYTHDFYMMTYIRVTLVWWVLPVLYGDVYIATRPIWTDLGRGHI